MGIETFIESLNETYILQSNAFSQVELLWYIHCLKGKHLIHYIK